MITKVISPLANKSLFAQAVRSFAKFESFNYEDALNFTSCLTEDEKLVFLGLIVRLWKVRTNSLRLLSSLQSAKLTRRSYTSLKL